MDIVIGRWACLEAASKDPPADRKPRSDPPDSDEVLMQHYQRGNEGAFRRLYERHRLPLLRFVRRLSPDAAESEEIVQETWMAVIQGRNRYLPRARFVTWLFAIARRRTMDRWRKRGRSPEAEQDGDEVEEIAGPHSRQPEWQAANIELGAALLAAVSALPILQREAFLLRAEAGLSIDEIAQVTNTSQETAKSRLRYALRRLRVTLEPWT